MLQQNKIFVLCDIIHIQHSSIEIFNAHHGFKCNVMNDDTYPTTTTVQHSYHLVICMRMPSLLTLTVQTHSAEANAVKWNKRNKCKRDEKKHGFMYIGFVCLVQYSIHYMFIMEGLQCAIAVLSENIQQFGFFFILLFECIRIFYIVAN